MVDGEDLFRQADVVVISALAEESADLWSRLREVQEVSAGQRTYHLGLTRSNVQVAISVIHAMGNASAAEATRRAIVDWNPALILLVGIAGGFAREGVDFGDVLVPELIVGFEHGKVTDTGNQDRYEPYRPSRAFLDSAYQVADGKWFKGISASRPWTPGYRGYPRVFFAPVASGEKVIASKQWAEKLRNAWPKAVGVEMEGLGFALTSYRAEQAPDFGIIKAASDLADAAKNDRFRKFAVGSATSFAMAVIDRFFRFERQTIRSGGHHEQPQRVDSQLSALSSTAEPSDWGRRRVFLCRELDKHSLLELADFANIRRHERRSFQPDPADWCRDIWDYMESRKLLSELSRILKEDMNRPDLATLVEGPLPQNA